MDKNSSGGVHVASGTARIIPEVACNQAGRAARDQSCLARNEGQNNLGWMDSIVVRANIGLLHLRRNTLQFAVVQIPGKIGKERRGDLHPDAMSFLKQVAGDQAVKSEFVNLVRSQQLPSAVRSR